MSGNMMHINLTNNPVNIMRFGGDILAPTGQQIAPNEAYVVRPRTILQPPSQHNILFRNPAGGALLEGIIAFPPAGAMTPVTSRPMHTEIINGRSYFIFRLRRNSGLFNASAQNVGTAAAGMFVAAEGDLMGTNFPHLKHIRYAMRSSDNEWQEIGTGTGGFVDTGLREGSMPDTIGMYGLWGGNTATPIPVPTTPVHEMLVNTGGVISVFAESGSNVTVGAISPHHMFTLAEEYPTRNESLVHFNDGRGSLQQGIIRSTRRSNSSLRPVTDFAFREERINGQNYFVFQVRRMVDLFNSFGNRVGSVQSWMLVACSDSGAGRTRPYLKSVQYVQQRSDRNWLRIENIPLNSTFGFIDSGLREASSPSDIFFYGSWGVPPNTQHTPKPLEFMPDNLSDIPYTVAHIPLRDQHNKRPGTGMTPTTITIHSTANPDARAWGERAWLLQPNNTSPVAFHVVVDYMEAVEVIPLNEVTHHAGTPQGNATSIGIEISEFVGSSNTPMAERNLMRARTLRNAVVLVAELLRQHNLSSLDLRTHNDWVSNANCPRILLNPAAHGGEAYQTWEWFVREVALQLGERLTTSQMYTETLQLPNNATTRVRFWETTNMNISVVDSTRVEEHDGVRRGQTAANWGDITAVNSVLFPDNIFTNAVVNSFAIQDGRVVLTSGGNTDGSENYEDIDNRRNPLDYMMDPIDKNREGPLVTGGGGAFPVINTSSGNSLQMNQIRWGMGGMDLALENSSFDDRENFRENWRWRNFVQAGYRRPRTAIGYTGQSGGRSNFIVAIFDSCDLFDVRQFFRDKGAIHAIALDGGGSTAARTREDGVVMNQGRRIPVILVMS